jgi:hypothetical protein
MDTRVRAVPVDRRQPRRRLKNRLFSVHGAIAAGTLAVVVVLAVVLAPLLASRAFGPRSSAAVALVLFAGMLGVVVLWRRTGRRDVGVSGEPDDG